MNDTKQDISLELIQSTIDENYIDADDRLRKLFAIAIQEEIGTLKESMAEELFHKKA